MKYEYIDRELSELIWQEELEMMAPAELAELHRRQDEARSEDYFEAAFSDMRGDEPDGPR